MNRVVADERDGGRTLRYWRDGASLVERRRVTPRRGARRAGEIRRVVMRGVVEVGILPGLHQYLHDVHVIFRRQLDHTNIHEKRREREREFDY